MSCKFCSSKEALYDDRTKFSLKGDFYPGIEVWIGRENLEITAVSDTYDAGYQEVFIPIMFCPVCGKRIGEEVESD